MARTNKVDQSFSPIMSYTPKFSHNQASDMSYRPAIKNQPCAENIIKVGNNSDKRKTWTSNYEPEVVGNSIYEPDVVDNPHPENTNGVNQDFGADMRYSPQETGADKTVNKPQFQSQSHEKKDRLVNKPQSHEKKDRLVNKPQSQSQSQSHDKKDRLVNKPQSQSQSNEVDQSFIPIMSYKPKFSHNQDFGKDMSYKPPIIGKDMSYEPPEPPIIKHKPIADEKTKITNQAVREDMSYKPGDENTKKTNPKGPNMSYKPVVYSTPEAKNTNGVNQAFGADMCYSPNIAENTKLTGADMSYIPKIENKPRFHDK